MRAVIKSLKHHQFFTLSFGVAAANLISFASVPLLARLYGSESFGIFAVYYSLSNLIGVPSNLRFEFAIPIAEGEEDAGHISTLSLGIAFVVAVIFATVFLFAWPRTFFAAMPEGYTAWLLTAVSILLIGSTQVFVQRSIRLGRLRNMSIRPIVERLGFVTFALLSYRLNLISTGLIWAQTLALFASMISVFVGVPWSVRFSKERLSGIIKKYSDFPKKNLLSTFLQLISTQAPMLIYNHYFSVAELGFLSIAQRLTDAPIALLSSSISVVYYRRLLLAKRDQFRRIFVRTVTLGALVLGPPCLIAGIFADPILNQLFGAKWDASHIFFIVLLPLAFSKMLLAIHQSFFIILRKLGTELYLSVALFSAQVFGIFLGLAFWNNLVFVSALTANMTALVYLVGLLIIYRLTKNPALS
ncbi:MAG: oligosaccharide flippase family protein [Bdellovibrionales bacterium]